MHTADPKTEPSLLRCLGIHRPAQGGQPRSSWAAAGLSSTPLILDELMLTPGKWKADTHPPQQQTPSSESTQAGK